MWNGHIVTIEFRHQEGGFGAKCRWDMSNAFQVVGIFNFKDISESSAGKINALLSGAETRVIHHRWSSHAGYHLSGVRIQNVKLGGLASSNIQAMIGRIERHGSEAFSVW